MHIAMDHGAHAKCLLHAQKYADYPVYGALLGKEAQGRIQVVDAVPLAHNYLLAPFVDEAMDMVRCDSHLTAVVFIMGKRARLIRDRLLPCQRHARGERARHCCSPPRQRTKEGECTRPSAVYSMPLTSPYTIDQQQ